MNATLFVGLVVFALASPLGRCKQRNLKLMRDYIVELANRAGMTAIVARN
ncbi:MAG: hypothetical protein QOH24_2060 [Verrucomicrobiota bacterium]|jgi:hypothetical protein